MRVSPATHAEPEDYENIGVTGEGYVGGRFLYWSSGKGDRSNEYRAGEEGLRLFDGEVE